MVESASECTTETVVAEKKRWELNISSSRHLLWLFKNMNASLFKKWKYLAYSWKNGCLASLWGNRVKIVWYLTHLFETSNLFCPDQFRLTSFKTFNNSFFFFFFLSWHSRKWDKYKTYNLAQNNSIHKETRLNHVSMIERRVKKGNSQSTPNKKKNKPFN